MPLAIKTRRVLFMGIDTGITASGGYRAALAVLSWLRRDENAPLIPEEYLCEGRRYPSIGRLYKNTLVYDDVIKVGLGVPDRRKRY